MCQSEKDITRGLGLYMKSEGLLCPKQMKSNGQMKYGIVFKNPAANTSPTIYLEEYYEFYQATKDLDTVIDLVARLYQSLPAIQVDEKKLLDYSAAKSRIIMKLVNTEKNRTFLETAPHIPFQDLSIVYHYLVGKSDRMLLSMPVNDEVLKEWGVDTLELHQQALANYNRLLPIKFANLNQHLLDRGFLKSEYYAAISDNDPNKDMYFLTNEYFSCGAVLMTCKNLMNEIADFFNILQFQVVFLAEYLNLMNPPVKMLIPCTGPMISVYSHIRHPPSEKCTKMSTLFPAYAKSRHVYILVQNFRLFSAMPKSLLFEIYIIYTFYSQNSNYSQRILFLWE